MAEGKESNIQDRLTEYGKLGVMALRADVEKVSATRKTIDSIRFEVSTTSTGDITLSFYGREFFKALETGRAPRKNSTYQNFDFNLDDWLRARGFPTRKSKSGTVYYNLGGDSWWSAKALAWKINKEGDSIYKQGGRVVYSETLTKLAQELKRAITKDFRRYIVSQILQR